MAIKTHSLYVSNNAALWLISDPLEHRVANSRRTGVYRGFVTQNFCATIIASIDRLVVSEKVEPSSSVHFFG